MTGALPNSETIAQLMIENIREFAIFACDESGTIVSWNAGVSHILGYSQPEFIGRHVSTLFTPEDIENGAVELEMSEAAATGHAEDVKCHVRKDGSRFWGSGLLMPLRDPAGELHGYAMIIRDNSRQKKYQIELESLLLRERSTREAEENLRRSIEKAEKGQDEFLGLFVHELRTPLNSILGWVKLLRKGLVGEEQVAKALAVIEANAEAQNRLIEDVFDVVRIDSGNFYLNSRPMLLAQTVSDAVESIQPLSDAKDISVQTTLKTECGFINGDPGRISQIITNILSNSVKFTPSGGNIRIAMTCAGPNACVVIEDTGRGISAELLPHLFERFVQAEKDSTRGNAGLGLGLPLAHKLVEQHGGQLMVESKGEGRGSTFTLTFPLIETN